MPTIIRFPAIKRVYMFAITSSQSKASATKTYGNHIIKEKCLRKKNENAEMANFCSHVSQLHWSAPPRRTCLHWQNKQ